MGYSFWIAAIFVLYASSHRQDITGLNEKYLNGSTMRDRSNDNYSLLVGGGGGGTPDNDHLAHASSPAYGHYTFPNSSWAGRSYYFIQFWQDEPAFCSADAI